MVIEEGNLNLESSPYSIFILSIRSQVTKGKYLMCIAVVITNQSTSTSHTTSEFKDPRQFGGKVISYTSTYIIQFGGKVISYTSTYIIQLVHRSATTSSVDARLVKSPLRGFVWHTLMIVESMLIL
jgi:hypothetical protein